MKLLPDGTQDWSAEARERWRAIDVDSQSVVWVRANRLLFQGWTWEDAGALAVGIIPTEPRHWPHQQRYQLAAGATAAQIIKDVDDWFWRTHCIKFKEN